MRPPFEKECVSDVREVIDLFKNRSVNFNNRRIPLVRGERDYRYKPTAGVFRNHLAKDSEEAIFLEFRRYVPTYRDVSTQNLWNIMILAQHHGLPTRLLDWTQNPLVAIYFACEGVPDTDAAVWIVWGFDETEEYVENESPFKIDKVTRVTPLIINDRIRVQQGLFTAHPNSRELMDCISTNDHILKIRIPKERRIPMLMQLDILGVNRRTLFPDLDGLGNYLKWRTDPELMKYGLVTNNPGTANNA